MAEAFFILDGEGELTGEQVRELRAECERWNSRAGGFWNERKQAEKDRLCVWDGQSHDGRMWDEENPGMEGPFDGSSDVRLRWADRVTLDQQALLMGALMLGNLQVHGTGAQAQRHAARLYVLLRWMIRDMGSRWHREWMRLANWVTGDSPAVAMMGVRWRRDRRIGRVTVTPGDVIEALAARELGRAGEDKYEAESAQARVARAKLLMDGADDEPGELDALELQVSAMLAEAYGLGTNEARRAARELVSGKEATFAAETDPDEGPHIEARRYGYDFVVPDNCEDLDAAAVWFAPKWMTEAELRSRVASDGWSQGFVDEVLEQGQAAILSNTPDETTPAGKTGVDAKSGKRQVVWAYFTATDARGLIGRYVCVFGGGGGTAFGARLLNGRRNAWPVVLFQREVVDRYALSSRGVAELAAPAQGVAKTLTDVAVNNGVVGGLPPILAKGYSVKNQFAAPMRVIGMSMNEEFSWMRPPEFPAAASRERDTLERDMKDYFGEPHDKSDPGTVANRRRLQVGWFLAQASDVMRMMLEAAQAEASDEVLAEVTDDMGNPAGITRADIEGRFRIAVTLNADDMDSERLVEKMKAVGTVFMAMDRDQTIKASPLIASGMRKLFPDIGDSALRTEEAGMRDEREAETQNLLKIRAGVMPQMNTDGAWNYEARLAFYTELQAANPNVFADMPPDRLEMLQSWTEALAQQAQQFGRNRMIGKTGVEGVGAAE